MRWDFMSPNCWKVTAFPTNQLPKKKKTITAFCIERTKPATSDDKALRKINSDEAHWPIECARGIVWLTRRFLERFTIPVSCWCLHEKLNHHFISRTEREKERKLYGCFEAPSVLEPPGRTQNQWVFGHYLLGDSFFSFYTEVCSMTD